MKKTSFPTRRRLKVTVTRIRRSPHSEEAAFAQHTEVDDALPDMAVAEGADIAEIAPELRACIDSLLGTTRTREIES